MGINKWMFGGIERWGRTDGSGTGRIGNPRNVFFVLVKRRNKNTLLTLIREKIRPGTVIYSDCWAAYKHNWRYGGGCGQLIGRRVAAKK